MHLLIPELFADPRLLELAARDLKAPALQTLLARGTREACPADGVEAAVCTALGIARQQDWPVAPITLAVDGGRSGDAYWLRADPVHLHVMRDRIVLADHRGLEVSREDAAALTAAVTKHFGDALSPLALHPERWYVRLADAPRVLTTPPSLASGRAIEPTLPRGEDARRFRRLINEVQMLLHEHPVNLAREARGLLPINSLWLWGGGKCPRAPEGGATLFANDADVRAIGTFCKATVESAPAHLGPGLMHDEGMVLLDGLHRPARAGDAGAWRKSLLELEGDWFEPLHAALAAIGPRGALLSDPVNGKALRLHAGDRWKCWRRRPDLRSALA